MANRFLNNITINDEYTLPAADGTTDQVITTDGAGQLSFVDQSTLASGSAEVVEVPVKNVQGSGLTKGDPVYISGSVGASGILEVQLADAGNSAKMPAVGLLKQDLANNGEGFVVVTGKLRNLTTSPIDGVTPSEGDIVYVKSGGSTGAALTTTKPTGSSNLIQNMGKVGRVSTSSDGTFVVSSILRSNDVPNLSTGKIWVGDGNTVESSVVFLDETNSRMGINTTSPSEALYVIGNVRASGNFIGTNAYWSSTFGNKGTNQGIRFEAPSTSLQTARVDADAFAVNFGGTGGAGEVFRILEGGNVGIGTNSPNANLHVYSSGNGELEVERASGALFNIQSQASLTAIGTDSNHPLYLKTNAATRMAIATSGNVGIGTTAPGAKLQIGSATYAPNANLGNNLLQIKSPSGYAYLTIGNGDSANSTSYIGGASGFTVIGSVTDAGVLSEYMRITNAGKIGIGTTSPSRKLHVNAGTVNEAVRIESSDTEVAIELKDTTGTATIRSRGDFRFDGSSGEIMRMESGGNVGIGTTSPAEKLTVSGDSNITGKLAVGSAGAHPSIAFYNQNDAYFNGAVTVDDTLDLVNLTVSGAQGTDGQVLTSTGSGVAWEDAATGTVTGTGAATQVAFWDGTSSLDGDANLYFDSVNKRLGVGTSSPTNPLTVVGSNSISIDDYIIHNGDTDTYFGFSADGNVNFVSNAGNEMLVYDGGVRVYNTLRSDTNLIVGGTLTDGGGGVGSNGQVLSSTGSGVAWTDAASGGVSSITAGTGLTGGTITTSGTIALDYAGNDNFIIASGTEKTSPSTSDYIAIVDAADLSKPVKYAEIGNLPSSGGAQIVSYNFSSNHNSNNTAYYYQFRNQSNGSMVLRAITWPNWGGQYYADLTVPDDCFLKSFVIRSRNGSTWSSGLQIKMRIKKNTSTTEYDGAFVTSTGSGESGQVTFSLTSSDTSFSQGDAVAIGFNATGAMGYITAVATFELT